MFATFLVCLPLAWLAMKTDRTRRQRRAVAAVDHVGGNVWYLGPERAVVPYQPTLEVFPYDSQQPDANVFQRLVEEATAGDVVAVDLSGSHFGYALGDGRRQLDFSGHEMTSDAAGRWILHGQARNDGDRAIRRSTAGLDLRELRFLPSLELLCTGSQTIGNADLKDLGRLKQLRCLLIYNGCEVTSEGLSFLGDLAKLRVLVINKSRIDDAGLRHITPLRRLEVLELDHAPIRGDGLAHLRSLSNLKLISLRCSPLEDHGLTHLTGLTGLQRLYFFQTRLTDAGLAHLKPLRDLRLLHLGKTAVTFPAANAFERDLPRSPIVR